MDTDIREILFDKTQDMPLLMDDGKGLIVSFEQVYATELAEGIFCILRPLAEVAGITAQTAFVFSVDDGGVFHAVKDKKVSDKIFAEYYEEISGAQRKD